MIQKIKSIYNGLPEWVKKAITDAFETGLVAVLGLGLAFPSSFADLKAEALVVGAALGGAALAAARRAIKAHFGI